MGGNPVFRGTRVPVHRLAELVPSRVRARTHCRRGSVGLPCCRRVKRRAELAGEIEETHNRLRKMIEDLEKLDSVILQFDPSHQVEAIKPKASRPPSDWSHRGEMTKTVLSILRQAAEPLTSRDIALELLVTRALDKDDQKLLALMTKRVGVTLRLQRVNGVVRSASGPGQYVVWEIASRKLG
jgi:hypothetical protein